MITIIDYDTGNLRSVANALGRLGAEYRITADPRFERPNGSCFRASARLPARWPSCASADFRT